MCSRTCVASRSLVQYMDGWMSGDADQEHTNFVTRRGHVIHRVFTLFLDGMDSQLSVAYRRQEAGRAQRRGAAGRMGARAAEAGGRRARVC